MTVSMDYHPDCIFSFFVSDSASYLAKGSRTPNVKGSCSTLKPTQVSLATAETSYFTPVRGAKYCDE